MRRRRSGPRSTPTGTGPTPRPSPRGGTCSRRPRSGTRAAWPPAWRRKRAWQRTRCAGWAAASTPTSSPPSTPPSPTASMWSLSASVALSCRTTWTPLPLGRSAPPKPVSSSLLRPATVVPAGSR
uniref:Uncharacterized protein n=1 Tax=Zea mays TaxID=4577 RepID=C4J4N4_MAIZE|nr:unknown [Zea mays]